MEENQRQKSTWKRERSYVGGNSDFYWVLIPLEREGGEGIKVVGKGGNNAFFFLLRNKWEEKGMVILIEQLKLEV